MPLQDRFGRPLRSLRISVTQDCNLRCFYCHGEGQEYSRDEMSPSEIERIVEVGARLGMRKVKLTGGEPLMRTDIADIVGRAAEHADEVSMTTNGTLLEGIAGDLRRNGLKRVNVSLDTLDPRRYEEISGVDSLEETLRGIDAAVRCGLGTKLNVVMLRGMNESELPAFMEFAGKSGAVLQLIELTTERCGVTSELYSRYHMDLGGIEESIRGNSGEFVINELHNRVKYHVRNNGGACDVELVRPMHNTDFCGNCTRLRLTSDGKLKPCLLSGDGLVDIAGAVRSGASPDLLEGRFMEALDNRRPYWSEGDGDEN